MKTIVSITPISIDRDSRTFKQASTVSRLGYKSIVVELEKSNINQENLMFELRSVNSPHTTTAKSSHYQNITSSIKNKKEFLKKIYNLIKKIVPLYYLIYLSFFIWKYWIKPYKKIPKASLYYLHAFYEFPPVLLKCKTYKAKFIYDAHDFYSDQLGDSRNDIFSKRLIKPFFTLLEKMCIKCASNVVTVAEGIADLLKTKFNCFPEIVHNFEDTRLSMESPYNLREKLNLRKKDIILLSLGNCKNNIAIKEAIQSLIYLPKNVNLIFVGGFCESYFKIPATLNLASRVHFLDAVMPYEVINFIKPANISLILYIPDSKNNLNSCPNKLFQSVSADLPIIYSKLPEIKRFADMYNLGVALESLQPQTIANAVKKIINEKLLLNYYTFNTEKAKQALTWESEEKLFSKMFSEALQVN